MAPITVYSTPRCGDCKATCASLKKKGLKEGSDYRVVDVTQDEEALAFITGLGYSKAPVVVTPTDHWCGHRIDKLIGIRASLTNAA